MSEDRRYKGTLKKISTKEDLIPAFKVIVNAEGIEVPDYIDLDSLEDVKDFIWDIEGYTILNDCLYIVLDIKEYEDHYYCNVEVKPHNIVEFDVLYYNGCTTWEELVEEKLP